MVTAPSFRSAGDKVLVASMQSSVFDVPLPVDAAVGDMAVLQVQGTTVSSTASWPHITGDGAGVDRMDVFAKRLTSSDVAAGKATVTAGAGAAASPGSAVITCWQGAQGIELYASGGTTSTSWKALATSNPALVVYLAALGAACTAFTAASPAQRFKWVENPGRMLFAGDETSTSTCPQGSFSVSASGSTPSRVQLVLTAIPDVTPPTPTAPAPGAVAQVGRVQFEWQHTPGSVYGQQVEWSLKLTDSASGVHYYDAAADALTSTPTWNAGTANLARPVLSRDAWSWQVATKPIDGARSGYSTTRALQTVDPPTVVVSAPSGTVTDPAVAWTTTVDPAIGTYGQTGWLARYWTAEQVGLPGWDEDALPLVQGSGTSETTYDPGLLSPGGYRVAVMARESGNVWSAWTLSDFTIDTAVSGSLTAPVLSVMQGGLPSGAPATRLEVTATGQVQVDYSDDGTTWVRATCDLTGSGVAFDATAPLDAVRSYRARVTDGTNVSAWSGTVSHTLWAAQTILVDLLTGYAVPGRFVKEDARTNPAERDVMAAIGRTTEIVSSDVTRADRGSLTVSSWTAEGMQDMLTALSHGLVMARWTQERDFDGPGVRPADDVMQVTSDVDRDRLVQNHAYRSFTFSWTAQPKPAAVLWVE